MNHALLYSQGPRKAGTRLGGLLKIRGRNFVHRCKDPPSLGRREVAELRAELAAAGSPVMCKRRPRDYNGDQHMLSRVGSYSNNAEMEGCQRKKGDPLFEAFWTRFLTVVWPQCRILMLM